MTTPGGIGVKQKMTMWVQDQEHILGPVEQKLLLFELEVERGVEQQEHNLGPVEQTMVVV